MAVLYTLNYLTWVDTTDTIFSREMCRMLKYLIINNYTYVVYYNIIHHHINKFEI